MTDDRRRERALDAAVAHHFAVRAAAHTAVIGAAPDHRPLSERAQRIVRRQYEGLVDAILAAVDGAPPPPIDVAVAVSPPSNHQEVTRDRNR